MILKLIIISTVILIISLLALAIRIVLKKDGIFKSTHIGENELLKKKGLSCARYNDVGCNPTTDLNGCSTCGVKLER